ncbi:hypothetical protein FQR65_LT08192 [Abscondita terminalis]|nr:hypothetical protein FQR65_LT08192 [Abscondita terminalis]
MGLTTDEFVIEFHHLTGFTQGERKKSLFKLLNDNIDCAFDLSLLIPQSLFEQRLKFEVLKFYKNHAELLEMLKAENPAIIEKILNLDWFIKETFENLESKILISEIFPNLSYISKMKLLNKMCLFMEKSSKCDEYFWSIKEAYGKYMALKLLPACSETLIFNIMEDDKVELTPKQLLLIIKRNPSRTDEIFEILESYDRHVDIAQKYEYVLKHLMKTDVSVFMRLNKKYTATFKLGSRSTRKFVTNNKVICLSNSEKLHGLLKGSQIAKSLNKEFSKFYSNIFPKSLEKLKDNFDYFTSLLLKGCKTIDKLELLLDTFKSHYGEDLLEHHEFMVFKLFEWMPSDFKDRWLENHEKPNKIPQETWISFMGIKKSIPLLKERILMSSNVIERARLVEALVSTCKINKDEMLLKRRSFLTSTNSNFNLKQLQERHWKHLTVLIHYVIMNDHCHWLSKVYFASYISMCFEKQIPCIDYLKVWVQHSEDVYELFSFNLKYQKRYYEMIADVLPLCFSNEQLKTQRLIYIWHIASWDSTHPRKRISLFKNKDVLDTILHELENPEHTGAAEEFAMNCIISDFHKAKELKLLEVFTKNSDLLNATVKIEWLLKYHSLEVFPYIKVLVKRILITYLHDYKVFRHVVDPKMKEAIADVCQELLKTDVEKVKIPSLQVLSVLLPQQEFLQILDKYRPQDLFDDQPSISKFKKSIPTLFLNVTPTHLTFEYILQYCQGDYFKCTQNVLYQICNNVAEKRLGNLMTSLNARSVSARKHSILLALRLLNQSDVNRMLKNFMMNEENVSIRKHLFSSVFNLFLRNPDDYSWQLVKENIEGISHDDTETFCKLANPKRIPKQFFVRYLLFAWKTIDALPFHDKLEEAKSRILGSVTQDNVALLPNNFCLKVIRNNLFQNSNLALVQELNVFTCKYLIYSGYECMNEVFCVIKTFSRISCKYLHNFVKDFCQVFIKKKCVSITFLTSFAVLWDSILKPYESLENYLYIQFTILFMDSLKHKSIETTGAKISEICSNLFDIHCLDISIFKDILVNSFMDFMLEELGGNFDENYSLLTNSIVESGKNNASLAVAIALIPLGVTLPSKSKIIYDSIIDAAGHNTNPLVQVQLHSYLINN